MLKVKDDSRGELYLKRDKTLHSKTCNFLASLNRKWSLVFTDGQLPIAGLLCTANNRLIKNQAIYSSSSLFIALTSVLLFLTSFSLSAQKTEEEPVNTLTELVPVEDIDELNQSELRSFGENAERLGDYFSAIEFYTLYMEIQPESHKVGFRLAECYRRIRDYENAKDWYLMVYELKPKKYPQALFYHARMQMAVEDYAGALGNFEVFRKLTRQMKKRDNPRYYRRIIRALMESCEIAPAMLDTPIAVKVTHLDTSINRPHIEFSPLLMDDSTLIYASLKMDTLKYFLSDDDMADMDTVIERPVRKFYFAKKEGNQWMGQGPLPGPFNRDSVQTGNGTFSTDKNKFFFTRCKTNWQRRMICAIYVSEKDSLGNWQQPVKMPENINDPKYSSTQPAFSIDSRWNREVLYFVSDRPGGKGGLDIWYAMYDPRREAWRDPKNIRKLNTVGDEMTPWYDMETRTLYFSSDGLPGMGQLDIFKSSGEMGKFSDPENLGYPLNTGVDELYYSLGEDMDRGFFVSNRAGGVTIKNETCCDDIYSVVHLDFIKVLAMGNLMREPDSIKPQEAPLEDALISLYRFDPSTMEEIFIKSVPSDSLGEYALKLEGNKDYKVSISKEGYFSKDLPVSTMGFLKSDTIHLDTVRLEEIPKAPIVVKNIYYPFDKDHLTDSSKTVIDTTLYLILTEHPEIIVEISAHTDSKGTDKYNLSLSQRRAESVVKYLIGKGIDEDRLVAKGYGASKPLAPNENPDGTDNPEGRAKNRRTEFEIIGVLDQYSEIEYEE